MKLQPIVERLAAHDPAPISGDHDWRERAAVLVPLVQSDEAPSVVLTERATTLNSHGGEVAFPGGKQDPEDSALGITALRETHEEIGVPQEDVTLIGELRPFVSKHGLLVTPYVGLVAHGSTYEPNPHEIAHVFEVPVSFLLEHPLARTDVIHRHGETQHVPVYEYRGFEIWGLTAMILAEFLRVGCANDSSQGRAT